MSLWALFVVALLVIGVIFTALPAFIFLAGWMIAIGAIMAGPAMVIWMMNRDTKL